MNTSRSIEYSIIIPIEGRAILLKRLLESIKKATAIDNAEYEVFVIDSSPPYSSKDLLVVCEEFGAYYLNCTRNVRQKRNLGAKSAKYHNLLFIDSDCEASENLFVAYSDFIRESSSQKQVYAAAGPTRFQGGETFFTNLLAESSLLSPFKLPEKKGQLLWTTTSNFLVSRKAFEQAGGFHEDFPFRLGGDDTEFGLRLHQAGCKIQAIPQAICKHSYKTWASPIAVMRRSFRWGWMQSVIIEKHKAFRRWASPGLPLYYFCILLISLAAYAASDNYMVLFSSFMFLFLSVFFHAVISAFSQAPFFRTIISDLVLALVECPFGFGKFIGSISNCSLSGILYRIGIDDSDMDKQFTEIVNDLWSNNIAILITTILILWMV